MVMLDGTFVYTGFKPAFVMLKEAEVLLLRVLGL
jgi:hypothetical protein